MNLVSKKTLSAAAVLALFVGACSSSASPTPAPVATPAPVTSEAAVTPAPAATPTPLKPVTIEWWHITTGEPGRSIFTSIANAYTTAHPNVTIHITVLENEAFKAKLTTTMQSGQIPDLFQSWGGGVMASQVAGGNLQDITAAVAPWASTVNAGAMSIYQVAGKQYGIPWDMGMIGVWYNKALFTKAGISAPPASWADFLADVGKLKAAGIVPLAIAGKDKWPSMHLWTYLVLRIGGSDNMTQMINSKNWNTDACTAAGNEVLKLNALNPYQPGFKGATYDNEAAAVGNAKAAMEVMGQWAPGVEVNDSANKKGIGSDLGWFPFPMVDGGKGDPNDGVGGGNGIAVGKNAPPEAIDFLKFFSSADNAKKLDASVPATALSPVVGTSGAVTDANLQMVLAGRDKAKYIQLYLDQATTPALGSAINDATIALFDGASTPEKTCQAITTAAAAS